MSGMAKRLLLWIGLIWMYTCSLGSPLLPFGLNAGDKCFFAGDDTRTKVTVTNPISYFGTVYYMVWINSNGYITFVDDGSFFGFEQSIAPVSVVDLVDAGFNLYCRESTNPTDLQTANDYVDEILPALSPYSATSALIVTWNRFRRFFTTPAEVSHTFQVIILTSTTEHVVLFLYGNMFDIFSPVVTPRISNADGVNIKEICTTDINDLDDFTQSTSSCAGVYGFTLSPGQEICNVPVLATTQCQDMNGILGGCDSFPTTTMPTQGERIFENVCDNCIISGGFGFNSNNEDCSCYFLCELSLAIKTPVGGSPWVSYKRCCACHQTFSKKLLTCVDFTDKRSDCFDSDLENNPCSGLQDGSLIPRPNPDNATSGSQLCSGFIDCEQVGEVVVPNPDCCPQGQCYDDVSESCDETFCDDGYCGMLRMDEKDDCDCESTPAPESECAFVPDPDDITRFMGLETMYPYQCAVGTCWDQNLCACVRTNNTGYDNCDPFASLEFDDDLKARDNLGNIIYTVTSENVEIVSGAARFDHGYINVAGLANTYLSNDFVLHFSFTLRDDDSSSSEETECFVGNCYTVVPGTPPPSDTLAVTIDRGDDSSGTEVNVFLTYQDRDFMSLPNSMETILLEFPAIMMLDTTYDFWLIYCGSDGYLTAGVLDNSLSVEGSAMISVTDSRQLIHQHSGFKFGSCLSGEYYEGDLDNIEMWRNCKPFQDEAFEDAYVALKTDAG